MAGDCQSLINTLTAVQDTALAEAARRESDWCEDGTLGETLHRAGRVVLDAADLAAPVLGASHAQAQRRVELAVRLAVAREPVPADGAPLPDPNGLGGVHTAMAEGRLDGYRASVIATSWHSPRPRSPRRSCPPSTTTCTTTRPPCAAAPGGWSRASRPTCCASAPSGRDLDRAAPLGLGAGRRHLARHVPQRGCRGRLGRDRPARARPGRRRHLLEHRAGPREGAHRPRHQQRDDRRAGRAHRAGRQRARRCGRDEDEQRAGRPDPIAVPTSRESARERPLPRTRALRAQRRRVREASRRWQRRRPGAGAGSPTVGAPARAAGLAPRPPRRSSHAARQRARDGAAAVRALRPAHRRPPRPRRPPRDRCLRPAPSSRRWSAPATAGVASPGAAWQPASATSTTCGPGRPGPPRPTTCSPCADGTTASSSDPAGGCAWHPTAPRPGPTPPAGSHDRAARRPGDGAAPVRPGVSQRRPAPRDDRPRRPADIHRQRERQCVERSRDPAHGPGGAPPRSE